MSKTSLIKELGVNLKKAGRLQARPLCIYGLETIPENAVSSTEIHFCISNVMISLALRNDVNTVYFGMDKKRGSCPGMRAWLGYEGFNPFLKNFLSTGIKKYPAENLVSSADIAEKKLASIGKITPVGKYTVIRACEDVEEIIPDIKAIICFGQAEQIRNLCMLAYFTIPTAFDAIKMPWGSSCSSFITYPAGLSENGPKESVILGPMDPTDNYYFPPDILCMGIPIEMAKEMNKNIDDSFIVKRELVAFPNKRVSPSELFSKKDLKGFSENLFKTH